ncbi:MAG: type VI secretion system ATPase TssH [Deltaproteobacteria bacterium]|nr:type VI secretion system ATPase TssH [Deltaproteobacteria bacterium]MBK8718148.1 type VI secretion system ATPase TssH [Deltaproteobacteria bacterium]MBP7292442.1 type VI secretion system ATPase TssH [Nannocystaceae bacterium]
MRVEPKALVRRLNPTCTRALEGVVERAAAGRYYEITPDHMLHGLLLVEDGDAAAILHHFRKDRLRIAAAVERSLQKLRTGNAGRPMFAETLFTWFENAWVSASLERNAVQLRSADLLLEFVAHVGRYTTESFADLEAIDENELKKGLVEIIAGTKEALEVPQASGEPGAPRAAGAPGREALDRFTISFTDKARKGEIDPIFGRDAEIRQVIDILARRRKNNPIIVGEPGVGKTALVEGLARAIVAKEVPAELQQVELLGLDMGLLKAGAGVRGELENRLKKVIAEVKGSPTPIIVFIDEAHTLIGQGADGNEIPNLLKPALARGEMRTIAATTWSEYKKYFEKDAALERRFQPVKVDQPTVADAVLMLRGLRHTYENAHDVIVRDDAVIAAVELSERYITGRQLPDKAVDLLDTAAARVRIEQDAPPAQLTQLRSELASVERELTARRRDIDDAAAKDDGKPAELQARIEQIQAEMGQLEQKLAAEKDAIARLKHALTQLREAEDNNRAERVSAVEAARASLAEVCGETPLVHAEVDRDSIGQVVADWTGIPVGKMKAGSIEVVLELESNLEARIKGQNHATKAVAEAIRMSHAGVRNPETPIAVMLFVGPSGVGKTETALALADLLYGGERSMTTINMSEFQEKHTVSRLIGSPPGYVGYGEGGMLTEAVRQKPYSVVLLDECEKADLEVMNLFYQVFDKGMLSDGEGRVVNFRNTVVILTSNLATDAIMKLHENGAKPSPEEVATAIRPILSKHFKPALLARMTMVPYRPMDPEILADIAKLKLASLGKRIRGAHGTEVTFEDSLITELVGRCTESETGARALDHALRGSLMPNLARSLLEQMAQGAVPPKLSIGIGFGGAWRFDYAT